MQPRSSSSRIVAECGGRGGTDEGRENGKEVAVGLDVVVAVLERTNPNDCYLYNCLIDKSTYCP